MLRSSSFLLAASLLAQPLAAAETVPFTPEAMIAMDRVGDPQPSPDGRWLAVAVRKVDAAANRGRSDLWLLPAEGGEARQLTRHEKGAAEPRWAPDGQSLYFLSARSGSNQVWRLPLGGGEAQPVTQLPLDVASLAVSPTGTHLAFSLEVYLDCTTFACTTERTAAEAASAETGRVYERLFVRHWDTWKDGRRKQLFVQALQDGVATGEPVQVSKGLDADVPSQPFGGAEEIAFSRDGKEIVFAARLSGKTEAWSTNLDLYVAPIDGSAAPRNLTAANPALDNSPRFSPDGKTFAWLAMRRPGYEADRLWIQARSWPNGESRVLAADLDRSPDSLAFSPDGKTLYATANDVGKSTLFAIDVATGKWRRVVATGTAHDPVAAGDRVFFRHEELRRPSELFSVRADGTQLTQLTRFNAERLAGLRLGQPEQFSFPGWNGETVHAWIVKPVDFDPAKKYPLAFLIHGGPQGSFGDSFHYRWNPQVYAGRGYAAVMVDFHGSTGYGQAFTDSIQMDWGGKPLEDLQKGLAAALARYPWIDKTRTCALGASYGGYMINWIAGKWFDAAGNAPFRCLVNHDGVFDQRAMAYSTEELWFTEWENGGTYYDNAAGYEKHNPVAHVARWKTPMLVVQGEQDFRVPDTQSLSTFTALQRRGIPSKLLFFPDENHWVLKPANSLQWHREVLGWLDQWTK
jgi:dipeptidyl aminopeptidase/acylaminoacyl peptidase